MKIPTSLPIGSVTERYAFISRAACIRSSVLAYCERCLQYNSFGVVRREKEKNGEIK